LSPKTELMTFIGYSQGNYLFMRHEACYTTFSSPKAIFDELFFPFCPNNIYGRKRKALTSVTDLDNTSLQRPSAPPRPSGPSPPDDLDKESSSDRFIFPYVVSDSRESSSFPWDTPDCAESPFSDLLYKDIEPEEPEEIVIREPEQQPKEVEEQPQEIYSPDTSQYQPTTAPQTLDDSQVEKALPPHTPSPAPSSRIPPQSQHDVKGKQPEKPKKQI
jgi:hypothetical protein